LDRPFQDLIAQSEKTLKEKTPVFNAVGYLKVFFVILLAASFVWLFFNDFPFILILAWFILLGALAALWIYHDQLYRQINYYKGTLEINQRHLDRLTGRWNSFGEIGDAFSDSEHPYATDLDIIGKKSLFQYMNTTHTWYGRRAFADDLLRPSYTIQELSLRQEAVRELSEDLSLHNELEYRFSKIGTDSSILSLVEELKDETVFFKSRVVKGILAYLPLLTVTAVAAAILFRSSVCYIVSAALISIQGILWLGGLLKISKYLGTAARMPYNLGYYSDIILMLHNKTFRSKKLNQIKAELSSKELSAASALRELDKLSNKINMRSNGIMYFLLNILFLWDYGCVMMLEDWKKKHAGSSEKWFLLLGETESLLSLSILPHICANTCIPEILKTGKTINAKMLGHPLLPNDTRVNNDIELIDKIFIISGSNMSGKTTFLRTVGLNLVLAQAGGFVCAERMCFSPSSIITSMRISDDLNDGISTYYAELKRIKRIIEQAGERKYLLFLIDEIFKGTNSVDRLTGAQTVLERLNTLGVIGMITTHDLTLCDLAGAHLRIENYSFSEEYTDHAIRFDYKLKHGRSTATNAKFLMKMVGIIE
jgi:hypothetical protein